MAAEDMRSYVKEWSHLRGYNLDALGFDITMWKVYLLDIYDIFKFYLKLAIFIWWFNMNNILWSYEKFNLRL